MSRKHFQQVAPQYDTGRTFEKGEYWAGEVTTRMSLRPQDWLLDMGCGTGLFSGSLSHCLPCSVVGLDLSLSMLRSAVARTDAGSVSWVQGRGEEMPLKVGSTRAVFLSQVWHHLEDHESAAKEIYRILQPGGGLFIKTFSHSQIRRRWDLTSVFPELLPFMLEIYPDCAEFKLLLDRVGFSPVDFTSHGGDSVRPSELLRISEARLWSMFSYISDAGLAEGRERLLEAIDATQDAPVAFDETLVWAVK